jgi:Uma2 family endonuclease
MGESQNDLLERLQAVATLNQDMRQRLVSLLLSPSQQPKMTYEQFLEWADEDTHAEWVNGEVIMTGPASRRHQEIKLFLGHLIGLYVEQRRLGRVLDAPFQMKLENSGREPDLLFVMTDHLARLRETYLDGPADLAVEIISPESVGRDRGEKFYEYAQVGIPEYWLIDPLHDRAEFYQLDSQGSYQLIAPGADGIYRSAILPGFWLRVSWLWDQPSAVDVLRELGVI